MWQVGFSSNAGVPPPHLNSSLNAIILWTLILWALFTNQWFMIEPFRLIFILTSMVARIHVELAVFELFVFVLAIYGNFSMDKIWTFLSFLTPWSDVQGFLVGNILLNDMTKNVKVSYVRRRWKFSSRVFMPGTFLMLKKLLRERLIFSYVFVHLYYFTRFSGWFSIWAHK